MSSDNVIYLLLELNPELVERVLIVPKLEYLFDELKVKNKVGVTHAAKYIKNIYKTLNVESDKLSATFKGVKSNVSSVVHLAVRHCKTYKYPDEDYFNNHCNEMHLKYGNEQEKVEYDTTSLSYRSPILSDTLNAKGAFSIVYLQAAYKAYKILKLKHEKRSENLDELLGI